MVQYTYKFREQRKKVLRGKVIETYSLGAGAAIIKAFEEQRRVPHDVVLSHHRTLYSPESFSSPFSTVPSLSISLFPGSTVHAIEHIPSGFPIMEDKETELLSRVTANHLFLGQFEPFRAMLRSLRDRNPDLARTILQTIVGQSGRMGMPDPVIWSDSCPSPAILTFLCTLELLQFPDATSNLWSFDPNMLRLRSEFLLYVHIVSSRVMEIAEDDVDMEQNEKFDEDTVKNEELRVLGRLSEVGANRLKPDLIDSEEMQDWDKRGLSEGDLMTLRGVILESSDIFDVLCLNIGEQVGIMENEDSGGLAIALRKELRRQEDKEEEVLRSVQKCVQVTHLDAMRQCLENGDENGAVSHVRFLHLNCGVEEEEYR